MKFIDQVDIKAFSLILMTPGIIFSIYWFVNLRRPVRSLALIDELIWDIIMKVAPDVTDTLVIETDPPTQPGPPPANKRVFTVSHSMSMG